MPQNGPSSLNLQPDGYAALLEAERDDFDLPQAEENLDLQIASFAGRDVTEPPGVEGT